MVSNRDEPVEGPTDMINSDISDRNKTVLRLDVKLRPKCSICIRLRVTLSA